MSKDKGPDAHDIFVSYSREDSRLVDKVIGHLSDFDLGVWRDRQEMVLGERIREKILKGIQSSSVVLVFISRHSVESPWVLGELGDISEGSTRQDEQANLGHQARVGWDPCTGWGVPNGRRLLTALKVLQTTRHSSHGKRDAPSLHIGDCGRGTDPARLTVTPRMRAATTEIKLTPSQASKPTEPYAEDHSALGKP